MIKEIKYRRLEQLFRNKFNSMISSTHILADIPLTSIYYTLPGKNPNYDTMIKVVLETKEIHIYSWEMQYNNICNEITINSIGKIIGDKHGGGDFKVFVV